MAKNKKIIEEEPIVIDKKAIINEEVPAEDVIDVEAPEVIAENSDGDVKTNEPSIENPNMSEVKKLICRQSFTDKFDDSIVYTIGDELNITDEARRKDLIERGLAVEE